jgi:hypothetical protein
MKKMLKRKEELLILLDAVKCADHDYYFKLQTINDIEYQLNQLEDDIYHYKMMKPLKYMLYGFTIISIILITYAIFK